MAESGELMGRLRRLEQNISALQTDVGELKTDVGELKADVGVLKADVGVLKIDTGLLKAAVLQINDNMREMRSTIAAVHERLDRLIAVTVEERTVHYERLREIERRLTRLEERVGVD
jgi:chromosome segregation ATPase